MKKTKAELLKNQDEKYIVGTYKRSDLCLSEGSQAGVKDLEGNEYIDFSSGIGVNSFGFSDEGWVKAITDQACKLQHTSNLYYTEPAVKVARLLVEKSNMSKVFFANSGAEANECAIKTVRKYSNEKYGQHRNEIITLKNSFHGRTMTTITATGQEEYHQFFHPFSEGFFYVEPNNIAELERTISDNTCAIMIELIQGEGGVNSLDHVYVDTIVSICKEKDILLIVDEIQTGIGRTGTFFAFEQFNIQPDLVTVAKGLGGGLPVGAVIFNEKTENVLTFGDHGTTFGGNLIVCAGAAYILESLDEKMLAEINEKSEYIRKELLEMDEVEFVSGLGLMIGIKHKTKSAKEIAETCLQEGLIVLTAKEKVRLLPPLNISWEQLEQGLNILKKVLKG
ncbi:MAG: acetylornithine/succinylornithine family transaminase [Peptostreptococcaceae bacterium]|nr:acetylornithine/succinylornithine family transaminase [Peptostreptococcaceae bacterium]